MFDREGFKAFFFRNVGDSPNTLNTYNSYFGRIDRVIGGLDERLRSDGGEKLLDWMLHASEEPFSSHRSQSRAITRSYIRFWSGEPLADLAATEEPSPEENEATVFRFERELQAAVRIQLEALEPGLSIGDGGSEVSFASGRSDILARDRDGGAVVIELKAGPCPKGAFEQLLGYAQDWIDDGEPSVRCFLVAGSFSPRQLAAARRIPDLQLKTYRLAVQFSDVEASVSGIVS